MRVHVVLSPQNASWVIGKIAHRLVDELARLGIAATLSEDADDGADINHWMSYAFIARHAGRASTVFITHIDDPYKALQLKDILAERADVGLCLSRHMMRILVSWGLPADRLWYVLPALDTPEPARVRIAVATRLYADGRKREDLLVQLASERDLSPFHFEIAGSGWEAVIPKLRDAGAAVNWDSGSADYLADHRAILDSMRTCEYYLYLGMDEGSLGTLDALALGIKTIVTPQGFHLEIPDGITAAVETYEELRDVFDRMAANRARRIDAVRSWTWTQYAREHVTIWDALLQGKRSDIPKLAGRQQHAPPAPPARAPQSWSDYYARLLSPRRILSAVGRTRLLQPLRRKLRR